MQYLGDMTLYTCFTHFLYMSSSSFAIWRNCWASMCHQCWHLVRSDAFVHCFILWSGFTCSDAAGCSSPGGCEEWRRSQGPNRSHSESYNWSYHSACPQYVDDFVSYSSVVHVSFKLRSTLLLLHFHLYSCFRTTACSMRQKLHKVELFNIILSSISNLKFWIFLFSIGDRSTDISDVRYHDGNL